MELCWGWIQAGDKWGVFKDISRHHIP